MEELVIKETLTDIVQLPAIAKAGRIEMNSLDLMRLSDTQLKTMAEVMEGEIVYVKYRAEYKLVDSEKFPTIPYFCMSKDCYRPVDRNSNTNRCSDHAK